ncbi:hypothetical protein JHK82_022475 [Glycine max]|uniref:Uncharacterized protein n=1 Tax=Glycine max TaxID=3847 RepID=K7L8W2_SOYBN|nr:hypothetical protein JHK85_022966 [Glycine max]KAG5137744.1 hypothetical protein JHK82_022475 [Glycine max]KAH1053090.1 hypothetical protein GYH30_022401 [Glycine max]
MRVMKRFPKQLNRRKSRIPELAASSCDGNQWQQSRQENEIPLSSHSISLIRLTGVDGYKSITAIDSHHNMVQSTREPTQEVRELALQESLKEQDRNVC